MPENVHVCLAIQNRRQTVGSYSMVLNLSWLSFFISSSSLPPPSVVLLLFLSLSLYLLHVLTHPTSWSPSSLSPSPSPYFHSHLPHLSCTHSFFFSSFSLHLPLSIALACATSPPLSLLCICSSSPFLPKTFLFFNFFSLALSTPLLSQHNHIFSTLSLCSVPQLPNLLFFAYVCVYVWKFAYFAVKLLISERVCWKHKYWNDHTPVF